MTTKRTRWAAAAVALAAAATTALLIPAPAAAGAASACPPLPYGASASADLLRLHALDLGPLGIDLGLGPAVDVRVATTGAGMSATSQPAAVAAARDLAANLLGLDALGLAGAPNVVSQQAPPAAGAPVSRTAHRLDVGVLRADLGTVEAAANWQEPMQCGAAIGVTSEASARILDAAVLPATGKRALVALPHNLSSRTETALVTQDGHTAAQARAAASLVDLRLLAGSPAELTVRVISEPELVVTATGDPDTTAVTYRAPVLEVAGTGLPPTRLDSPGSRLDVPLTGPDGLLAELLAELLAGLDPALAGLTTAPGGSPELGLPDLLPGLPPGLPALPALGAGGSLTEPVLLRLSLGALQQEVAQDGQVTAAAASLRLQLLTASGEGPAGVSAAVLDLGIGVLAAAATAPPPPADPGCGDCPSPSPSPSPSASPAPPTADQPGLPVTGSTVGGLVGTGILFALAGRLFLLLGRYRTS